MPDIARAVSSERGFRRKSFRIRSQSFRQLSLVTIVSDGLLIGDIEDEVEVGCRQGAKRFPD